MRRPRHIRDRDSGRPGLGQQASAFGPHARAPFLDPCRDLPGHRRPATAAWPGRQHGRVRLVILDQLIGGGALLAVAVLYMGLFPKPFTDVMDVSVVELLKHVAQSKLPQ